ncbi:MAG: tRNA preQ1(34) S-adenosylmethionine ribosyltransferase-isomerase QueA [Deltaproteobacteria bacterium]|nr:tRNA preQ1(34) S-adenosylmethionine ribosyltransferase-isomerase QueA [Deltaproteobacteria bacterium]
MDSAEFDYSLPPERIAQRPARPRDASRILLLSRHEGALAAAGSPISHAFFRDLPRYLRPGDLLVVNDARVVAARLRGRKQATGGGVEILLLGPAGQGRWRALARGLGRAPSGTKLSFTSAASAESLEEKLEAELLGREPDGAVLLGFSGIAAEAPTRLGEMPIPPYIRKGRADEQDRSDYQTCFAATPGAVAAPTASLHFTRELLERISARGVEVARLTLHVGWGTFAPIDRDRLDAGRLHSERFALDEGAARAVNEAKAEGRRVIAVGTTTARVLESVADSSGRVEAQKGATDLFIRPGHRFRCMNALITNFHLPRSSLLMLVAAFAGREHVLDAYREALAQDYRFYSYGDAMFIY